MLSMLRRDPIEQFSDLKQIRAMGVRPVIKINYGSQNLLPGLPSLHEDRGSQGGNERSDQQNGSEA
jgi:hypothetical protein